ncbi:dynein axonemal assembly factor 11-like isoform X2 [Tigriopus californicus]|uniref:dynein axonemal assembly factor 11-like isoform X2 n=1 Tax=Tigriopus californicus TaxID=6832 RepID=UPI0027DA0CA4|nr:dynein axonemal assembly factor 11-like isoform X2 [Tigriopus californicus]
MAEEETHCEKRMTIQVGGGNRITDDLLVRRAEHNDGHLTNLEEISLHQQHLEKLDYIHRVCAKLKQLHLQDNCIGKIENLKRLKSLEYLNMAMNNVELIENLERCESLTKLDLTLNFIADLVQSVDNLRTNIRLQELTLMGNPCTEYQGYREYVIATLPQLKTLDGRDINKSERIQAQQRLSILEKQIREAQVSYFEKREREKHDIQRELEETRAQYEDPNLDSSTRRARFFQSQSRHAPEFRQEISRKVFEFQKEDEINRDPFFHEDSQARKANGLPKRYFDDHLKPLNINQAKLEFVFDDSDWNFIKVELHLYKHLSTSDIQVDIEPQYLRVTLWQKRVFQLRLCEEVRCDSSLVQRSQTTGHLMISMPRVNPLPRTISTQPQSNAEDSQTDQKNSPLLEVSNATRVDYTRIVEPEDPYQDVPDLEPMTHEGD